MIKDTIVIDLDGTLSDCSARRHLVSGKHRDYAAFHAQLVNDKPAEWCADLMAAFVFYADVSSHRVVIVSARPWSTCKDTAAWLHKHDIKSDEVFLLRNDGDSTPDQELKRRWLHSYGKDRILFVVDDRAKVVRMWREEGVTCLQCDDWEERARPLRGTV